MPVRMQHPEKARSDGETASTITTRDAGRTSIHEQENERPPLVEALPHRLSELDGPLALRILRLEAGFEGAHEPVRGTMIAARVLRVMLYRATRYASPTPGEPVSFDRILGEALCSAYAWAFLALDGLLAGHSPPDVARVESSLVDTIEVCEVRAAFDLGMATLRDALEGSLQAARVLARPRGANPESQTTTRPVLQSLEDVSPTHQRRF